MSPSTTNDTAAKKSGEKSYTEEWVAILYAGLVKAAGGPPDNAYMSALSSGTLNLTASSFQHKLRSIKHRAAELNATVAKSIENPEGKLAEVTPSKKRGGANDGASPTPSPKKAKSASKAGDLKTPKTENQDVDDRVFVTLRR